MARMYAWEDAAADLRTVIDEAKKETTVVFRAGGCLGVKDTPEQFKQRLLHEADAIGKRTGNWLRHNYMQQAEVTEVTNE